jgi:hypothetical protein
MANFTHEITNVCRFLNPRFIQLGVDFAFGVDPPIDAKRDTATNISISKIFPHISKSEIS